jgi:hypothetical protein
MPDALEDLVNAVGELAITVALDDSRADPECTAAVIAAKDAVAHTTRAIGRVLSPGGDSDQAVTKAWEAVAQAQDLVRSAHAMVEHSRLAREKMREVADENRRRLERTRRQMDEGRGRHRRQPAD